MIRIPLTSQLGASLHAAAATHGVVLITCLAALAGCSQRNANAEMLPVSSEPAGAQLEAQPSLVVADEVLSGEAELRRGYGAVDMRFEPCVTRETDYALKGSDCSSGIVVYGPYVAVPANAQIEVSFEVKPDRAVHVYADAVSQMATQVLAGLNPQLVEAGETQRLGYFVNVPAANTNVESRIGIRADEPVGFSITNLTMTVR